MLKTFRFSLANFNDHWYNLYDFVEQTLFWSLYFRSLHFFLNSSPCDDYECCIGSMFGNLFCSKIGEFLVLMPFSTFLFLAWCVIYTYSSEIACPQTSAFIFMDFSSGFHDGEDSLHHTCGFWKRSSLFSHHHPHVLEVKLFAAEYRHTPVTTHWNTIATSSTLIT